MKNKKSQLVFNKLITAILALIVLLVIVGLIYTIILGKQIPFISGETERMSDCDGDGARGVSDDCPCDKNKQKLEKDDTCGTAYSAAETNCPKLCK